MKGSSLLIATGSESRCEQTKRPSRMRIPLERYWMLMLFLCGVVAWFQISLLSLATRKPPWDDDSHVARAASIEGGERLEADKNAAKAPSPKDIILRKTMEKTGDADHMRGNFPEIVKVNPRLILHDKNVTTAPTTKKTIPTKIEGGAQREKPAEASLMYKNFRPRLVLLRAIGNALPPRHDPQQAVRNLNFTLMHEEEFPYLEKHWVLNRIIDDDILDQLTALLHHFQQNYTIIPFRLDDYDKVDYRYDYYTTIPDVVHDKRYAGQDHFSKRLVVDESIQQDKNLFVTNQNGARNQMIEIGISYGADWILPWDGNCFLHRNAFRAIYEQLQRNMTLPEDKYAYTPMNRAIDNLELLDPAYDPTPLEEPQVILHRSAKGRFHPKLRYGRKNKVEFLQRLGVPGPWDGWPSLWGWESQQLGPLFEPIPDLPLNYTVKRVGWTSRLFSGVQKLETEHAIMDRRESRNVAMEILLEKLDRKAAVELHGYRPGKLLYYDEASLARDRNLYQSGDAGIKPLVERMIALADRATQLGPWSVMDKPNRFVVKSHDKHYFLGSAYRRKYDEAFLDPKRLRDMNVHTTVLGLAYFLTGNSTYAHTAARNIRTWFLDTDTKMHPHLAFARAYKSKANKKATDGVADGNGMFFFLDAVRLVETSGQLNQTEMQELNMWFTKYLSWIEKSKAGINAYTSKDYNGVWFDAQAVAVASFVNDTSKMLYYINTARSRVMATINADGRLHNDLKYSNCVYRQLMSLHGWSILARMAGTMTGKSVWDFGDAAAEPMGDANVTLLCRAFQRTVPYFGQAETCPNSTNATTPHVDIQRWWPLVSDAQHHCPTLLDRPLELPSWMNSSNKTSSSQMPPKSTHDMPSVYDSRSRSVMIAPFWNLGLDYSNT